MIVDSFPSGGVQVDVTGPPDAGLQVTAVPLGASSAGLDLTVNAIQGKAGELRLRRGNSGAARGAGAARLDLVGAARARRKPRSGGFRCGRLDMLGIIAAFGTSALDASGEVRSKPIRLAGVAANGPLVIKVIGTDAKGRRIAAWAELDAEQTAGEP